MSSLLCPTPKCMGKLKWLTDIEDEDLLENGIIECQSCKERFVGIPGWSKAMKERRKNV